MATEHRVAIVIDGSAAKKGAAEVTRSFEDIQRKARELDTGLKATKRTGDDAFRSLVSGASALKGAFLGLGAGMMARDLLRVADAYTGIENRLKLVTASTAELETAQRSLFAVAQETYATYGATADLYTRLARSTDSLGISQQRLVAVTESVNQAIAISGASAQSAEAALFQLGQGLGAGALRGEELNSVLEQTPRLAQAIADGLGVTVGQLRNLGSEGQLTAERVIAALESQADALDREFGSATRRASDALTQLRNEWERTIATAFEAEDGTRRVVDAIDDMRSVIADPTFQRNVEFTFGLIGTAAGQAAREINELVGLIRSVADMDLGAAGKAIVDGSIIGLGKRTLEGFGVDLSAGGPVGGVMPQLSELQKAELAAVKAGQAVTQTAAALDVATISTARATKESERWADELRKAAETERDRLNDLFGVADDMRTSFEAQNEALRLEIAGRKDLAEQLLFEADLRDRLGDVYAETAPEIRKLYEENRRLSDSLRDQKDAAAEAIREHERFNDEIRRVSETIGRDSDEFPEAVKANPKIKTMINEAVA
ncbi:tape measure protein [Caenispirillum bisanense]|uniref:Tape measure domain-containing protein n=1 Tax=Caenispirillum bisanense TaxID=414052 RepID=A0A286GMC3_9PROT|nr:tape measure protein [Caenispirillum bisanense]SOD96642.1 tape measure domain-containing protein [Caenispirillum bisanense]